MEPRAQHVMTAAPRTVSSDLSLPELEEAFISARVSGFPVVDGGRVVGVVCRSDLVRRLVTERTIEDYVSNWYVDLSGFDPDGAHETLSELAARTGARVEGMTVGDLMTRAPVTVPPETPIGQVARLMCDRHIHRLLVAEDDRLIGIVTSLDLVGLIAAGKLVPV